VERWLKSEGFRSGFDLILKHRNKPNTSSQLFPKYISRVLLPYVDELRSNEEFADKKAVVLMDNCPVQVQGDILQMLADQGAKVLMFPPHTAHIFQSLDLSLFGNFKKRVNDRLPLETDQTTAGFMKHLFHMMKHTLVEDTVRSFFMQLGLTYDINTIPYLLIFDENVFRQSPGFSQFGNEIPPVEKLSQTG
jgi:hypothetical protein